MAHISREKDEAFRQQAIEGSLWQVVFRAGYPLALYQMLVQLFKILDTVMASYISSEAVSAVAYLSQISMLLSAVGGGLAVWGRRALERRAEQPVKEQDSSGRE